MDIQGFTDYLHTRGCNGGQVEKSIAIVQEFLDFMQAGQLPPTAETAWAYSRKLIAEDRNSEANYFALARYHRFIRANELFVGFLELIDGGEVNENLYRRVGERFGEEAQAEFFAGIGVAPYGTPTPEKPAYLQPVIERLEAHLGKDATAEFLSPSLRDLPDESYYPEREKYRRSDSMDAYLVQRKQEFVDGLESCLNENRLFFSQEITREVIDFVINDPEIGGGRREGNIIYETKIPYMTARYLAETDPVLKRYYACHCPWARTAIRKGDVHVAETFCYCSGGFHKKAFEIIFNRPLRVEVLESVAAGQDRCRFAIYLPEDFADL